MSERWQDFGLKSKKSVGELKEMMEKGQISSAAVAKAFELATDKGGKFNNMMGQIGETSYGKMQILQGQWENIKIQAGNALMPIWENAMKAASGVLDFLNVSKTVPATLQAERGEVNALVGVIGTLNMGNTTRAALIGQLITKYPDLFKNIDVEKIKNSELLAMLNDINSAYDKRIGYATNDLIIGNATRDLKAAKDEYTKFETLKELNKRGETGAENQLLGTDAWKVADDLINKWQHLNFSSATTTLQGYYGHAANDAKGKMDEQKRLLTNETNIKQWKEAADLIQDARNLYTAPTAQRKAVFGGDKNREAAFDKIAGSIQQLANGQWKIYGGQAGGWQNYLKKLMGQLPADNAAAAALITDPTKKGKGTGGDSRADGIIGGGGKNVIINMHQFMENLIINAKNVDEGVEEMEYKVLDGLGRVLESANAIKN
jgi:hypothetical protein